MLSAVSSSKDLEYQSRLCAKARGVLVAVGYHLRRFNLRLCRLFAISDVQINPFQPGYCRYKEVGVVS